MPFGLLEGVRILDLSGGIAGPYATKLLADAGADVVKVESPGRPDPLRCWVASGQPLAPEEDGALFQFLNAGKRAIVASMGSPALDDLLGGADLLVEDGDLDDRAIEVTRTTHPHLVIASVSSFGRHGPWAGRPATEFTLQAECGSTIGRGVTEKPPVAAGGRLGEWITGAYLAIGGLAAVRAARQSGLGDHVDLSMFEAMCNTMAVTGPLSITMNPGPRPFPRRMVEVPSIEATADGYVGFCVVTGQQFQDFLVMIGRTDLSDDPELSTFAGRRTGRQDFSVAVREWTAARTTQEVVEFASMLRVPVTPVGTPDSVVTLDHFATRKIYAPGPSGRFVQPRSSYQVDGAEARPDTPAPEVGQHHGLVAWDQRRRHPERVEGPASQCRQLPMAGLRIVDLTSFWAGPISTQVLALLGADVIHLESIQHPDGMRFTFAGNLPSIARWWESSGGFQSSNVNKRGVTLDLNRSEGRDLLLGLVRCSDALVENFSPRVLEHFGITWELLHEANPAAVVMRMPAFGLDGPWRDRTAFAQTIEQATGMAWITGYPDGPPLIPRGPCDPIAGLHASFALLAALVDRERTGRAHFVEAPMVEAALNVAAEIVLEHSAYGTALMRAGNRGPVAAPQGLYACEGEEQWLALAVATDEQWDALVRLLGRPAWASHDDLRTPRGRRLAHDRIDAHLARWLASHKLEEAVERLVVAGVPAARVADPIDLLENPQLRARHAIEVIDSPVIGRQETLTLPFRLASNPEPWIRRPAPTLGQDNHEVLRDLLGLDQSEIDRLQRDMVIGQDPQGVAELSG